MTDRPFISIVIPTLNEERCLPRLLSDLSRQKYRNFEVIIIDGKSEDDTYEVVMEYKKKLVLSCYLSEVRNVSYQRNLGAEKAKADYILFLDADVQIPESFIGKIKKRLGKEKGLVYILSVRPEKKLEQFRQLFDFINYMVMISQYTLKPFSTGGGSMIFDRLLFERLGGFDEKLFLSEDHEIVQRAQAWGVRAKFLNDVYIRYSMRRSQHDGRIMLLYKYIRSTAHLLFVGKIEKKIFDYQMGGHIYKKNLRNPDFNKKVNLYLSQIKNKLYRLLNE